MTILGLWVDEAAQFSAYVPVPKRGGTWLYCRHQWSDDKSGGGVTDYTCLFRTKRWRTYRRHWRRQHRDQL